MDQQVIENETTHNVPNDDGDEFQVGAEPLDTEERFDHPAALLAEHHELVKGMIKAVNELIGFDGFSQAIRENVIAKAGPPIPVCKGSQELLPTICVSLPESHQLRSVSDFGLKCAFFVPGKKADLLENDYLTAKGQDGWIRLGKMAPSSTVPGQYLFTVVGTKLSLNGVEGAVLIRPKTANQILMDRLMLMVEDPGRFPLHLAVQIMRWREEEVAPIQVNPSGNLNPEQLVCLGHFISNPICAILGPPGTGKSHVLCAILAEGLERGMSMLMTSNTNRAIDSVGEKLFEISTRQRDSVIGKAVELNRITRYGTPTQPRVIKSIAFDNRNEKKLNEDGSPQSLEETMANDLVTIQTAYRCIKENVEIFDSVVVDEVGMMPLPYLYCLAAIARRKLVVSGDPNQLRPVFTYRNASSGTRKAFNINVYDYKKEFKRTALRYRPGDKPDPRLCILRRQFRMVDRLAELVRLTNLYQDYVTEDTGRELPHGEQVALKCLPCRDEPFVIIDTSTYNEPRNNGNRNPVHADIGRRLVSYYIKMKGMGHLGVVTPYRAQEFEYRSWVKTHKLGRVTVGTVHSFQGSECPLMIWDTVESVSAGDKTAAHAFTDELAHPFLDTMNLLNVAVSRAKAKLIMIVNLDYVLTKLTKGCFLHRLIHEAEKRGTVVPAMLALQEMGIKVSGTDCVSQFVEDPFEFSASQIGEQFGRDAQQARNLIEVRSLGVSVEWSQRIVKWIDDLCLRNGVSASFYLPRQMGKDEKRLVAQLLGPRQHFMRYDLKEWEYGDFDVVFDRKLGYVQAPSLLSGLVEPKIRRWNLDALRSGNKIIGERT